MFVQIGLSEQLIIAICSSVVKPAYMLLSLALIVWLWSANERGLVLLRWGLMAFLFGEGACAVNFLCAGATNDTLEILHGAGMVGMNVLGPWGLFRLLDARVIGLTDPARRCAVHRLCVRCWKREAVTCGFLRIARFVAPALGFVALIPFAAPLPHGDILYPVFQSSAHFVFSTPVLLTELRLYPLLAFVSMLLAFLVLLRGPARTERAEGPFFAGFGFLSYALLRFTLETSFMDRPLWVAFWEETTELLLIVGLSFFLWVFREQLGLRYLGRGGRSESPERGGMNGSDGAVSRRDGPPGSVRPQTQVPGSLAARTRGGPPSPGARPS